MTQELELVMSGGAPDSTAKTNSSTTLTSRLSLMKKRLVNGVVSVNKNASSDSSEKDNSVKSDSSKQGKRSNASPNLSKTDTAVEAEELGFRSDIAKLYAVPKREDGEDSDDEAEKLEWKNTVPENLGTPAENEETAKSAIVARYVRTFNDPRRVLKLHSVSVQSSRLKKLLGKVYEGYPGVSTDLDRLDFEDHEFQPIVHRWAQLKEEIAKIGGDTEDDRITKEHADLFHDLAWKELKDVIEKTQNMMAKSVVTYEHLWSIFQPDDIVYARIDGQDRAFSYKWGKFKYDIYEGARYKIYLEYVDWSGRVFGLKDEDLEIPEFTGTRKISTLLAYPIKFHPRKDKLLAQFLERGEKFESFTDAKHVTYEGHAWRPLPYPREKEKCNVTGRVMVDTSSWNMFCADYSVHVNRLQKDDYLKKVREMPTDENTDKESTNDNVESADKESNGGINKQVIEDNNSDLESDVDNAETRRKLTKRQKIISNSEVRGYSFTKKLWLYFQLCHIKDIEWNERAFDCLVLPDNQKELILGFTEAHGKHGDSFDDFVVGKGKGIILLLCGPPGVGKTLSAAAVAEHMRVPLYSMTAGDLGYHPSEVEENLQQVWDVCARWSAVLLIDEADIFLEERSVHELERNKLVTVFLRVLEQFTGIMFLTTNRVDTFDPAFRSRIHISLEYNELSPQSRRQVWKNFLEPLGADDRHCITDRELGLLARMSMNGRQIKNVLKIAQLLALHKKKPLAYEHIMNVLDVTQHLHNSQQETDRQRSAIFL